MQRTEEKIGESNPIRASKIQHQTGNVNVFVLGTAMVIGTMWLVFQHDEAGAPTIAAATETLSQSSQNRSSNVSLRRQNNIEEVVVTAPRLTEKSERFERPEKEVALAAPTAPRTFWQSPS